MLKAPRTDFWRVGIAPVSLPGLTPDGLAATAQQIRWLPDAGDWRYLADPFALVRGDALHVFVEAYDYRSRHAVIERHELALDGLRWRSARTVLARPFHLSYPYVFEHEGETWMVPESHKAGEVAIYRACDDSLDRWERVQALLPGVPGADATLWQHEGRWWMAYAIVGPQARDQRELYLAHAETLLGPWTPFGKSPVHVNRAGARPAGSPTQGADGLWRLPVQDCSRSYGGATRMLVFDQLTPDGVRLHLTAPCFTGNLVNADHPDGLHTLSACAGYTLLDVKRIDRRRARLALDWARRFRRWTGRPLVAA